MKKIILVAFLMVVGAGCNKQSPVTQQQLESDNFHLQQQVQELQKQQDTLSTKANTVKVPAPRLEVDPSIKIEKCKIIAKGYADNIARKDYLDGYQAAMASGNTETAALYLQLSSKPEHPMDYDSNYETSYLKCLN